MRYSITALVALALGFVGSLIFLLASLRPSGPDFAIGKALPQFVGMGTMVVFGFVWLPANLVALVTDRRRNRNEYAFFLVPSALAFVAAVLWVYAAQRSSAEYSRVLRISGEAAAATNDFERFEPLVREYCSKSPRSIYPQDGYYRVIVALLENMFTPPALLQKLSDGLEDGHEFLGSIAQHPNCPEQSLTRFRKMPNLAVYLARNPKASPELLEWLSFSTNQITRLAVVQNPQTAQTTLERLCHDADSLVSGFATNRTNSVHSRQGTPAPR